MKQNDEVRTYWEKEPCGSHDYVVGDLKQHSLEWYQRIEDYRYRVEPFIHGAAQFTRHKGKRILEVGVGAGSDHLQWARAGCDCYGVDLTDAGIETTRGHLAHYGLKSNLTRVDAEVLPFPDNFFDIVYSWGVIHHSERPDKIIAEIKRTLKPGGRFIGMLYGIYSVAVFRGWVKYALLRGRPWHGLRHVVWHHIESIGTKAYTEGELRELFGEFGQVETTPILCLSDTHRLPAWLAKLIPHKFGWYIVVNATKPGASPVPAKA